MLEWLDVGCDKRLMYETALNRWSATEMRWNKNAVSRASPVAALNRRPTSVRKSKEQGAIAPTALSDQSHNDVDRVIMLLTMHVRWTVYVRGLSLSASLQCAQTLTLTNKRINFKRMIIKARYINVT